nr:MAG TPA: hypothetical protein [Caudoviricetes sp.]
MEKEKVLDIEVVKINDIWSVWHIKEINREILKNGTKDKFYTNDNWYHFEITEGETDFYYSVEDINSQEEPKLNINYKNDGIPNLIENNEVNDLVLVILEINEKYGIPKRWRAKENEEYYYIGSSGIVWSVGELFSDEDNDNYNLGNYFKTEEEAQKVIDSKEWQEFWAKVRAGEIGG